jgi:tetratricopeptide (TPR) repeat protein
MGYVRGMLLAWESDLNHANPGKQQLERVARVRENTLRAAELVSPADAENQLVLGYAFRALDQLPEAVAAFTLASRFPGLKRSASLQLSVCHDEMDQPQQARAILEELREQFPGDPEVANSLGYFLAEKDTDLDLAESLIREALEQEPGTGAYLDSLGWVKYRQGRYEEAFDFMIQAVNVLPEDPIILEHLGLVLREMGQVQEAEEMLRRALVLGGDPERIQAHLKGLTSPRSRP